MRITKLFLFSAVVLSFIFSGYQCSSSELTSAKLYIQQKNYDKAIEQLQIETRKNPNSDEGFYLLGVVQGEKELYKDMVNSFNKSLSISNKFQNNIRDSRKFFWANQFNNGVSFYQRATQEQDENKALEHFEKSIFSFNNAIMIEPDSSETYQNLAFVYLNMNKIDEAITPLQKIVDLKKDIDGYRFLGEIYYTKGMNEREKYESDGSVQDSVEAQKLFLKAIAILEEGRAIYPNDSQILNVLSNSYVAANKLETAIEAFKAGVEQEPDNKYYHYNYGVLLLNISDYKEASYQFLAALNIDPDYQNALYNLGVTYVRWGTALIKEAEERGEMSEEGKNKYNLAVPYLEKIVELNSKDIAVWELLGRVYTILGMLDKANDAYNKVDELR